MQDAALFLLAVAIELVEFVGNLTGPRGVLHAEEFDDVAGHIHPARSVDARRDAEGDFPGVERPAVGEFRDFEQRLEAGVHRRSQTFQSQPGEHPVFSGERDGIGDRRDRNHFHKRLQQPRSIAFRDSTLDQGLGQLESHSRAAQFLARVPATLLIGIDHRQRSRNPLRARKVMVGDDQVHAQPPGGLGRSESPDAHVHADDEPDARRGGLLDDVVAHVVAVADAVRNMEFRRTAAELDGGLEDYDCGGAIDVVVAVDEDRLLVLDGGFDPVNRRLHTGHEVWRVQVSKFGIKETFGGFGSRLCPA